MRYCSILLFILLFVWGIPLGNAATLADNGNGTVTDSTTGLVWQQAEGGAMTWGNALTYCEGLTMGGQDDWRLPNIKELESLADERYNPAIDKIYFPNVAANGYWSSSTSVYYPSYAWYVDFDDGRVGYDGSKYDGGWVRCVRGGQSGPLDPSNISATPPSLSFGTTDISTPFAPQTVTVTNNGTTPATLGTTSIAGTDSTAFAISTDTCSSATLVAGATCSVAVRFAATTGGSKLANLKINDSRQAQVAVVTLTGTAVTGLPTLVIAKTGAGNGRVLSTPSGIVCGTNCSATFSDRSLVTLTALALDQDTEFLGWSGGVCSGTGDCTEYLDYVAAKSTTITANFGTKYGCQQQVDDIVIRGNTCTPVNNIIEVSGAVSFSHANRPGNPVLKMDNGVLVVDSAQKRLTIPQTSTAPLYAYNISGLGNMVIGTNFTLDVAGSEMTANGQGPLAGLLRLLKMDVEVSKITLGVDQAVVEGKLVLPDAVKKRLRKKAERLPIEISISGILLSQSKGLLPGDASMKIDELEIKGTPLTLSDVSVTMESAKEELVIEGTVAIDRTVSPVKGMAAREFTGRITLANGGMQGFAVSADSLNIPLGASSFFLQKIGGSVDGFIYDPVLLTFKTSFSGGPKLDLGDTIGNYQTLCFNDVGFDIDPNSYFKVTGSAGLLCFDNWEHAKNGAIAVEEVAGEYNWKENSFKADATLKFPFEVLKSTGNMTITSKDFSGSMVGKFCAPKDTWWVGGECFADASQVLNQKGVGGNIRILKKNLAFFIDWGIGKSSWDTVSKHIKIGTNLNELIKSVKKSAAKTVGKSVVLPVADTITVPSGLDFVMIRATWQSGASDLTLTAPDGTVISPAYATAHPDTVLYTKLTNEAWYALENPTAGAWQADLANLDTLGTVTVSVNTLNTPPTVEITSPSSKVSSSTTVDISYTAADPDSTPTISLYYGTNSSGGAGVKIVEGLPMPSGTGTYSWDVSAIPAGVYYLFAIIDDGKNTPVIKYAAGTVEVVNTAAPASPVNFVALPHGTGIYMNWSLVSGATGYRLYYTDVAGVETYPMNVVLPADRDSYILANLKPSTTYRVTVTAFNTTGAESRTATAVTVTIAALPASKLTVSKETLDFGSVPLGQSQSTSLTITNAGNSDMILSKADLLGTLASSCAVTGVTFPATITSGSSATLNITFTPLESGTLNSTLQLSSNDPNTPRKSVALTATVPFLSFTVNPVAGTGGSMTPSTPQTMTVNSTTAFNITALPGYEILSVSGCSGTLTGAIYTTGAINAACDVIATFSALPVNGACGSSNSQTFSVIPTTNLCSSGTASAVTGTGPWNWSCAGTNGGTSATCTANSTVKSVLKGDVNNDNKIDIFDALLTLQYGLNLIPHDATSDANYLAHGDVAPLETATLKPKGDGKIDIMDALVILQRSVNLLSW